MSIIQVDLDKQIKPMKPMHGGGQPPMPGVMERFFHYITEAGIPYSRLHNVGGAFGSNRFVDVPNIFRDFDADENDPANCDFTFTDILMSHLANSGVEPYFRLGVSFEDHAKIKPNGAVLPKGYEKWTLENESRMKAYRTVPPKDYAKWARICEHIILHYTEGWANGCHYKIRYWEIWNEPDDQNGMMWNGTPEQYYEFYHIAASYLKAKFPHLMFGGYGSCGFYAVAPVVKINRVTNLPETVPTSDRENDFMRFFHGFFEYLKEHNTPIDFFSWHSYADVSRVSIMDAWLHDELERFGYGGIETHLNEWNPYPDEAGTAHHGAEVAALMVDMQKGYADLCCIYDMRLGGHPYNPLFNGRLHRPHHAYYSMVAFNALYKLGMQVDTKCDTEKLYVLTASNGKRNAMLMANLTGETQKLAFEGVDFVDARYYVLDQERLLSWAPNAKEIDNNSVMLIEW